MRNMYFTKKERNKLIAAFGEYNTYISTVLPDDVSLTPISNGLERRLERLIRDYTPKIITPLKRALVIAATVVLFTAITCICVIAGNEKMRNFVINVFENKTQVTVETQDTAYAVETVYGLDKLPEGYTLTSVEKYKTAVIEHYGNDKGDEIYFSQTIANGTSLGVNTENGYYEKVMLDSGTEALYYFTGSNSGILLTRDIYLFEIVAPVDKTEIIRLAQSIVIK